MKIAVVGTGYVGLVSGACFAELGFQVVCVDKDVKKIEALNNGAIPIFEPGLDVLVSQNIQKDRLAFTTNLASSLKDAQVVFIAVGTPTRRGDGHADLTYVFDAVKEVVASAQSKILLVTKSTVPVGTGKKIQEIVSQLDKQDVVEVASNPEFLREGSAIVDFLEPDRVVVGVASSWGEQLLRRLYGPLCQQEVPLVVTSLESAELIKYAANAFLATKITFINEIANLCEKVNADIQHVSQGIGLDHRIGKEFLQTGPGYGGSCFPKDTLALLKSAEGLNVNLSIVDSVVRSNNARKEEMANIIWRACDGDLQDKTIAILGVTFKPNTDDMRDSPSLTIIPRLQEKGANIRVCDPQGFKEGQHCFQNITWCENPYLAAADANALVILTEWNEFRALDLPKLRECMKGALLVDLRNIYSGPAVNEAGFDYISLGRPPALLKNHLKVVPYAS